VDLAEVDATLAPWRAARASRMAAKGRALAPFSGRWHLSRARGARRTFAERTAACGTFDAAELHCKGCGTVHRVLHRCRVAWACETCRKAYWRSWSHRLRNALAAELMEAAYTWRRAGRPRMHAPKLVLLTLTIRHSGDVELDRARIAEAWPRWRAWLWRRVGAPPFARVWEFTDGKDDKGHAHLHVATIWPFVSFSELHAAWSRATHGEGTHVDVARGKHKKPVSSKAAAAYLAKYATKGSESGNAALLCAWIRASTGRRRVTTSRRLCPRPQPLGCWAQWRDDRGGLRTCASWWHVQWVAHAGPPPPPCGKLPADTGPPARVAD
jgi:hypothetical protein